VAGKKRCPMARTKKKTSPSPSRPKAGPARSKVGVDELHAAMADGRVPVLVDVRTAFEFRGGHVAGSINIPMNQVSSAELPDEVWLICRTGNRSGTVASQLASMGKRVVDVAGGTVAWTGQGYPLVGSAPTTSADWASLTTPLLASLTLGLAPFVPEPHLFGKIRWVAGGAVGMAPMDWFDLVMHGAPWVWLLVATARVARAKMGPQPATASE
jgi:rhodanese-related sulfurtransferase